MDTRLSRNLKPEEIAEWKQWATNNRHRLDAFKAVLEGEVGRATGHSDKAETFSGPNALAELAHSAGYREGLRQAVKLLSLAGA